MKMRVLMAAVLVLGMGSLVSARNRLAKSVYVSPTYSTDVIIEFSSPGYTWVEEDTYLVNGSTCTFKVYSVWFGGRRMYQTVVGGPGPIRVESATEIEYLIPMDAVPVDDLAPLYPYWKSDAKALTPFNPSTATYNLKGWGAGYTLTTPGYTP